MVDLVAVRRAFRRSRLRSEVLLALERLGEASARDIALALGAEVGNVEGALVGGGSYRVLESVVVLGLVAERARSGSRVYSLTLAGRELAAQLRRSRLVHST